MLHKLDVRPLQSLHITHDHCCDDDHLLDHLCEKHGVLVVNIVISHPMVQHPSLVSQTLNPEHHHGGDIGEDQREGDENVDK